MTALPDRTKLDALPLFVDLDGTVTKSDIMLESMLRLARQQPLALLQIPFWLLRGRAYLKQKLAERVQIDVTELPLNEEFIAYLQEQNEQGRELILLSASDRSAVSKVVEDLPLFSSAYGSDGDTNLKGSNKVQKIRQLCGEGEFAYAGNSYADMPVWEAASDCVAVNCGSRLLLDLRGLKGNNLLVRSFDWTTSRVPFFIEAIRPHQWLKNCLLFLPLILAHELNNLGMLLACALAFVSYSLCASSVYLLNDMLDLGNDRNHAEKKNRPLAAGKLPLELGFAGAPILFTLSVVLAALIGWDFLAVLLIYWTLTSLYSLVLKQIFLLDVITLSLLYTLRLVAGAVAAGVVMTDWLLAFSTFLFLGMAMVKRVTELIRLREDGATSNNGRGYDVQHIGLLTTLGLMSTAASLVVFLLYISAPETTRLYGSPETLWLISPLLMGLLGRTWSFAFRGEVTEDPIMLVVEDRPSQAMIAVSLLVLWWAI